MGKINKLQTSFTSGEVSPRFLGRTDLGKYGSSLQTLENFLISPYGCVFRRPGFKFIHAAITNAKHSRLVKFEYSSTQSYQIEISEGKLRFYRDQGLILQSRGISNGTFTSGIGGWTARNSGTGAISHDAVNFRLNLTGGGGGNEARAYVSNTYFGIGTYTVTLDVITNSVVYNIGTTVGGTSIATGTLTAGTGKTFSFTPTTNGTVYIEFQATNSAQIDNVVLSSTIYQIDHPYLDTELDDLRFAESFDVLYVVHPSYEPRAISRHDNDSWSIATVTLDEPPYGDSNNTDTTITPSGVSGSVTLTASSAIFTSTDVGRAVRFRSGEDTTKATTYTGTGTQTNFDIPFYPQDAASIEVYKIASTGAKTLQTNPTNYTVSSGQVVMGSAPASSDKILIQPANAGSGEWGWALITAYTDTTHVTASIQRSWDKAVASTFWRLGAFSATTGYPSSVTIHEQRLIFGNTITQPQTIWASQTGVYTNFQPDNILYKGDIDSDTSFSFTVAANSSQSIMWMASKGALLLGTTNSIFSARGSNGGISSADINVKKEADISCAKAEPAETTNEVLFIENLGVKVHSARYDFSIDGYIVEDVGILADHIGLKSPIRQIVYQPVNKVLWVRRADGTLATCTYIRTQEVAGWARQPLGGTSPAVESLSVVTGSTYSEVWMTLSRTIGGGTVRYVECLAKEFIFGNKEDAQFLDSMVTYDGSPTTSVSGLSHLEGETISVLTDGATHPNVTVSGGVVTLSRSSSVVQLGYNYSSNLETPDMDGGSAVGGSQSQISRITEVGIKLFESIGVKFGFSTDGLDIIPFRTASNPMDTSPALFSGYKVVKFNKGYDRSYKIYISQDQPLPLTVLQLIAKAGVSDAQ